MSNTFQKTSLSTVVGTALATSLSAGAVVAAENPFAAKELTSGYMQLAEAGKDQKEMKCGAEVMKSNPEMKCGASMMQGTDAKADAKAMEGKCAGMKKDGASPAPAPAETPKP
ncbi:hypothetical protein [Methylococcus geothermalis]|uniref:Uncharacterized protein n=1 Tax=Methylococcus geothermalis TaxID=2681310 RepID=A0A858Q5A3_9GAMM|nr:hypothetical protein [Methylococcus geothermalis]QJD28916.1 hypothetical protein GNH96_02335 [Methylococcus geothermalis]